MRLALISDIHGNLVALDTVLEDIKNQQVDEIICLGDVAAIGPNPKETLGRLREIDCQIVMGNSDAELLQLEGSYRSERDEVDRRTQEIVWWCRSQLSAEDLAYMQSFPPTFKQSLGSDVSLFCFHGSPKSYGDIIMWTTPAAELDQMVSGVQATILAGGHTHVQMVRRHRDMIIINPGSVGLPYDKNPWSGEVPQEDIRFAKWAEYALITCREDSLGVELRRVGLDLEKVAGAASETGRPHAKQWAAAWTEPIPPLASLRAESNSRTFKPA